MVRAAVIDSPWKESWGSCGLDWGLWEGRRYFNGPRAQESLSVKIALPLWNRPEALEWARIEAGPWEERQREHQVAEAPQYPTPALYSLPLAPVLFEVGQEVGNGVVGPVDAQALAEAQQAQAGLGRAGPGTGHVAVGLLILTRHQGLL